MIKQNIFGDTLKEQLQANAADKMYSFLLADGTVRGAFLQGLKLVNEMRANHGLGVLETLVLGHAYMGTLLMASNLKGSDKIVLKITCNGPIEGLSVEANAFGEVRGYLSRNPIPIDSPLESFNLSPFFGDGTLSVTRHLESARTPFTGSIRLEHGNIAEDLAAFAAKSEQIPSAFNLSVMFNTEGTVVGAGGMLIQATPGADPALLKDLQQRARSLPSIGESLSNGMSPEAYLVSELSPFAPSMIGSRRVEFMCHCNKKRFERFVGQLPEEELAAILREGPFPLALVCHNCNTTYHIDRDRIETLYRAAAAKQ